MRKKERKKRERLIAKRGERKKRQVSEREREEWNVKETEIQREKERDREGSFAWFEEKPPTSLGSRNTRGLLSKLHFLVLLSI